MSFLFGHATAQFDLRLAEPVRYVGTLNIATELLVILLWHMILLPYCVPTTQFPCIGMHAFLALSPFMKIFKHVNKTEHVVCIPSQ